LVSNGAALVLFIIFNYTVMQTIIGEEKKTIALHTLQAYVHGDEGRAEDQQQDSDLDDAGCVPRRSEDPRGISQSGAQQVNGRGVHRGVHYSRDH